MSVGEGWPADRPSFATCLDQAMCMSAVINLKLVDLLHSVCCVYAMFGIGNDCCFTRSVFVPAKHLICFHHAIDSAASSLMCRSDTRKINMDESRIADCTNDTLNR